MSRNPFWRRICLNDSKDFISKIQLNYAKSSVFTIMVLFRPPNRTYNRGTSLFNHQVWTHPTLRNYRLSSSGIYIAVNSIQIGWRSLCVFSHSHFVLRNKIRMYSQLMISGCGLTTLVVFTEKDWCFRSSTPSITAFSLPLRQVVTAWHVANSHGAY